MISTTGGWARSAWRAIQRSAVARHRPPASALKPACARPRRRGLRARDARGREPGRHGRVASERPRRARSTPVASLLASRPKTRWNGRPAGTWPRKKSATARAAAGIVAAVEPELGLGGQQVAQRPGREPLQPGRPFGPAHRRRAARLRGSASALLVAQHRDGERGVHRLVRAGQAGQGQVERAVRVAIMRAGCSRRSASQLAAARQPERAGLRRRPRRSRSASAVGISWVTSGTPGLAMPAFSAAICSSRSPRKA